MFLTERILNLVVKAKDDAYAISLSAFDAAHGISMGAKEVEIEALTRVIADLAEQLKYERARADGLVDRLLVRDAKVASVSPSAIELAKYKDTQAVKKLGEIFESINEMGAEVPIKETGVFEFAGGGSAAMSGTGAKYV